MTEPDLNDLLRQTEELREQVTAMRDGLAETEVTGTAAGGAVSVRLTVSGDFRAVRIDPEVFDTGREEVEQAVLAALRDAAGQLHEVTARRVTGLQEMFEAFGPF